MDHSAKTTKLYSGINAQNLKNPRPAISVPRRPMIVPPSQGGITGEQKVQLGRWADQRDGLLKEVSYLQGEKDSLIKFGQDQNDSNAEAAARALVIKGNIEILEQNERDRENIISKNCADLLVKEAELQARVSKLEQDIPKLEEKKATLISDIAVLTDTHDRVYNRASILDQVVDRVVHINDDNINKVNTFVSELGKTVLAVKSNLLSVSEGMTVHMLNLDNRISNRNTATLLPAESGKKIPKKGIGQ